MTKKMIELRDRLASDWSMDEDPICEAAFLDGWDACSAHYEEREKILVEALEKIERRTFTDGAEGPELRNQNAANYRDAKAALERLQGGGE